MGKVVINTCYGGFNLSDDAFMYYAKLTGIKLVKADRWNIINEETGEYFFASKVERDDPILIEVVETMKEDANGSCSELKVVDIPPGTRYRITEYDGYESIEYEYNTDWKIST
jgi:hypothetical protein